MYIYVLLLQNDKYYVGKTNHPDFRIKSHFNSEGSAWTRKYQPLRLLELIDNCDDFDEDKYTKIYMNKYGIDNVRGGSYSQINLSSIQIDFLNKEFETVANQCYICGETGHFMNECSYIYVQKQSIQFCFRCHKKGHPVTECNEKICYRCGRIGHLVDNCFANNHIKNNSLHGCYNCGREGHWKITCNYQFDIYGKKINQSYISKLLNSLF